MAKKESTFLNMVVTLFLVTGIAGLALAAVKIATEDAVKAAEKAKLEEALNTVLPDDIDYEIDDSVFTINDTDKDKLIFYYAKQEDSLIAIAVESYTKNGFSGKFRIMVGFRPDSTIINTSVLEHAETPGLGDKMDASKSDWPYQFIGKKPDYNEKSNKFNLSMRKDNPDSKIDAITAATITSRAFSDAVERAFKALPTALNTYKERLKKEDK
ncbi:MAG: RnfABCDGE type electron transport complex subunit G [Bacteroidales bacterium]|nr:RnfABCDGE type electron transport complex subunit G [Bacteroidales bacterium]